jgi:hypothetical protein
MFCQFLFEYFDNPAAVLSLTFGFRWILAQNVSAPAFSVTDNDFFCL